MQQKRIQNRIAESRWTQAYVVSAAALVWVIAGIYNPSVIVPGICLLLSTYLMMELNNANALIRIYSRMVSCSFIVFCDYGCLHVPIYPISHYHVRLCRVLYFCFSLLSKHTCTRLDILCILLYRYGKYCLGTNTFLPTSTLGYYAYQYSLNESTQFCCISSRYNPSLLVLCRILSGQRRHYNTHPSFR